MPDSHLWLLRDTYAAETAWALRHVGKELRLARLGAFGVALGAIRADAELRRRHPGHKIEPLRSAEPVPRHRHRTRGQVIRYGHPDRRPCRTAPCVPPENQPATGPDDAPNDLDWAALDDTSPSRWAPRRDAILRP